MSIMKKDSNYPEPLYDVDKVGEKAKENNQHLKNLGRKKHMGCKTRTHYGMGGVGGDDVLYSKAVNQICECGWETKSAFKERKCDKCDKTMKVKDE